MSSASASSAGGQVGVEGEDQNHLLPWRKSSESALELVAIGQPGCAVGFGRLGRQHGDGRTPPPTTAPGVRAGSDEQAVEPGVEPLDVAQRRQVGPGADQGVLGRIMREIGVVQDQPGDAVEAIDSASARTAKASRSPRLALSTSSACNAPRPPSARPIWSLYTLRRSARASGSIFGLVREVAPMADASGEAQQLAERGPEAFPD